MSRARMQIVYSDLKSATGAQRPLNFHWYNVYMNRLAVVHLLSLVKKG
jgi:hypothetical protein